MGGAFGSPHGLEIPFVFGTVANPAIQVFTGSDPGVHDLSDQMQCAWTAFAQNDDPSCDEVGEWSTYDPMRRATMVFGPGGGLTDDPRREERLIWEAADVAIPVGHDHE
jgi:para-nitrobenzyl esterase